MWIYKYWINTRTPLYSFLFTVPLFFIYEIGIFLTSSSDMVSMRNGADALMRQILSAFGMNGFYWMGVIFFLGFILVFIYQKQYWHDMEVNSEFLPLMLAESMAWAMGLYFFMSNVYILLMNPNGSILILDPPPKEILGK